MAKIKVGIIGTGSMGAEHAHRFRKIRGVDLCACHDVDSKRAVDFARKHQIAMVGSSVDEVIQQCDALSIVTPDASHAALSLQVLDAGKHLLCEKPLTTSLADARRVARKALGAWRRHGAIHMINFTRRNRPAAEAAIKVARRGDLGEIRHVHASYLQSWLRSDVWGHWTAPHFLWRLQSGEASAGVLGDLGCHLLDLITAVAGDIEAVDCALGTFPKIDKQGRNRTSWRGARLDANDSTVIGLHFAGGALGVCHSTRWATGQIDSLDLSVHGTEGALRIKLDEEVDKLHLCRGKGIRKGRWTTRTVRATPSIHDRFIRSIRTNTPQQPDLLRGAQVQSYLDACQRSAAQHGRTTRIRNWQ